MTLVVGTKTFCNIKEKIYVRKDEDFEKGGGKKEKVKDGLRKRQETK